MVLLFRVTLIPPPPKIQRPAPYSCAVLLETVLLFKIREPEVNTKMPLPLLLLTVLLFKVRVLPKTSIPPPLLIGETLPLTLLLLRVTTPDEVNRPPPKLDTLSLIVLLFRVKVPPLS